MTPPPPPIAIGPARLPAAGAREKPGRWPGRSPTLRRRDFYGQLGVALTPDNTADYLRTRLSRVGCTRELFGHHPLRFR